MRERLKVLLYLIAIFALTAFCGWMEYRNPRPPAPRAKEEPVDITPQLVPLMWPQNQN